MVQHLAPDTRASCPRCCPAPATSRWSRPPTGPRLRAQPRLRHPARTRTWRSCEGVAARDDAPRIPAPHGPHLPVDFFFRSLAADQGPRVDRHRPLGDRLGRDLRPAGDQGGGRHHVRAGSRDRAVRRHAAQRASTAGWADFCLPPDAIAQELANISQHPYLARAKRSRPRRRTVLSKLIVLMRAAFGDRPQLLQADAPSSGASSAGWRCTRSRGWLTTSSSCRRNPDELRLLYKDMLISVTSFFRDPEAFDGAQDAVFPRLIDKHGRRRDRSASGCRRARPARRRTRSRSRCSSTSDDRASDVRIQIFGTDVDEEAIEQARRGVYPRTSRWTSRRSGCTASSSRREADYQVARRVRDMVRVLAAERAPRIRRSRGWTW